MKKASKKGSRNKAAREEFRPYRVLFLVVVISVTSIVLLAALGVTSE